MGASTLNNKMLLINKEDSIFLAGHNGMVGSAIKSSLLKKGYKNLLIPSRNELDLSNFELVKNWFKKNKPNLVILAAAKVGGIGANTIYPADFILQNLKIQNNIIENAWKHDVKRFLFLGSSCIYPKFAPQPLKEEYLLTGPLELTNEPYALAKIAGIKLCTSLKKQYGFDAICLMPTNLYGPGDNYSENNSHVLPALIRKFHNAKIKNLSKVNCWGSGEPKREFLYVDDLAEASIFAFENISSDNKVLYDENFDYNGTINIGVGKDISIKELAYLISKIIDYRGEIYWDLSKPDGTPRKLLDTSRINKLGWFAKTNIEEGIKLTLKNYLKELRRKTIRL
tara:strand:- start:1330 stop:2349 length:1020 start_codon:yes stop_codon:yes gene_type:complete